MKAIRATLGFAADAQGAGVAYLRLGQGTSVLRVPFAVARYPALLGREVGYGALTAVLRKLRERGIERLRLSIDDAGLASDLREHRDLPTPLAMPYVRVRCALNQFKEYAIEEAGPPDRDLAARARSEVEMHVAA